MGFFDSLFGGGKKEAAPKKKKKAAPAAVEATLEENVEAGIKPEIIAAISASINMVMSDDEMIAAIAAAIHHSRGAGTGLGLRIKRASDAWAIAGRQKIMDSRQFA
ncbi:MAG: hypothetical protein N2491_01080 [Negativicutes bacterium]|nr:hypothetical protein [Negativicutes bacterium]